MRRTVRKRKSGYCLSCGKSIEIGQEQVSGGRTAAIHAACYDLAESRRQRLGLKKGDSLVIKGSKNRVIRGTNNLGG